MLQNIKEGIEGKPVDWYQDVFQLVFPEIDEAQANNRWREHLKKPRKEDRDEEEDSGYDS